MIPLVQTIRQSDVQGLEIPTENEASDDRLIANSAAGDHRAFSQLVSRHADRMRAVAVRFTGNDADAEEIVQETFWRAWRKIENWEVDGKARFSTWLYRALVNQCIDHDRRKRVRSWFSFSAPAAKAEQVAENVPGPDRIAAGRETLEFVRADLRKLPVRQRVVLLLSVLDGRSNRNIGDILGISVGAVEQILVRARRKLRDGMNARLETEKSEGLDE